MPYKQYRPKLNITQTTTEKIWNIFGYTAFFGSIVFLMMVWGDLPEEVPAHYNAMGEVNRWGSKFELFLLPGIGLFLLVFMQLLERRPDLHNYPERINEENASRFYLNSRKMLNQLKNICLIVFALILFESVSIALEWTEGTSSWILPVLLGGVFVPLIRGMLKQRKIR